MKTKRLWSIFLAVTLVLSVWSVCYAEVINGDYMSAEGCLSNVTSTSARMTAICYVYSLYAPADQGEATATLYYQYGTNAYIITNR